MITFHPLSSGSGGNAYLVRSGDSPALLVDCGLAYQALQRKLWAEATSAQKLAGCLISHGHGDHCEAVPKLLRAGVDVYSSEHTLFDMSAYGHHRAHVLTEGTVNAIGGWRVLPFSVPHDKEVLGFMIEDAASDKLVYATDLAYAPDRFEGVNVFAIEANFSESIMRENAMSGAISTDRFKRTTASHMSIERLIPMLKSNDLSRCREIWLLHLSSVNSDALEFRRLVRSATGVPTYVAARHGGQES